MRAAPGLPGSQSFGPRSAEWGVPLEGVELQDGSGLSRSNRTTCAALAALLSVTPVADDLRDVLPVAGRDGTLTTSCSTARPRVVCKPRPARLTDVKALTGTQPGADRRDVDFSLVLNGDGVDDADVYDPIWRRLVALIDEYPIVIRPATTRFAPR